MELIRILKIRKFTAAVIILLLLNCIVFYITQQKSIENTGSDTDTYSAVFSENAGIFDTNGSLTAELISERSSKYEILKSFADAAKLKSEESDEYEFYAEEEALLIKENPGLYEEYKAGGYSYEELAALTDFYLHFSYQLEYQRNYPSYLDSIVENGKALSAKKLFSDEASFTYKSIQKSIEDFSANKNLDLSLVNDLPVSSVLNYQISDFILILMCIFIAILFVPEKNSNLLLNTCKNGRRMLKLKQLPILILFSVFYAFAIYISEIVIALKIYNAPLNLYAAIQSSDMFADCILHINFLQLFFIHTLFKAMVAVMISLILWLLILLSSNIIMVSGVAGLITATELLLYKNISAQSNLSFLKSFNIFSLFDYKSISNYNLISLFSVPVRADIIIWTIVLLIAVAAAAAVIIRSKHNYPIKTPKKAFRVWYVIFDRLSEFYAKIQSVFYAGRFETFKIMHIGKGLLVVAVFIAVIGFGFNTNPIVFSSTENFLNDFYAEYGGELSSEVYEKISEMQAEAEAVNAEFNIKSEEYRNGEISYDEYELAYGKNAAYDTQRNAVEELTQQLERIEALADKGITPVLLNEIGYNNLFFTQSNQTEILLLLCAAVILFSSVFSIEKSGNMLFLNHCSKNGRNPLYLKKIFTVIPKVFVLTLLSYVTFLAQNNYLYKFDNLYADIHNLQCLQDVALNLSIFEYIILNFVFEFIFVTIIALIIAALSAFIPQPAVIILSAFLFVLPSALYMIDIYAAKAVSASYLFNFNSFILDKEFSMNRFIIHFVFIVFCIVMLVLSQRKWCLTKDR